LDGERKTVTALFADIRGSTELQQDLDPEQARAIIDPALRLMMEVVHHYGGYVAQPTGDGRSIARPRCILRSTIRIPKYLWRYRVGTFLGGPIRLTIAESGEYLI
jgi:hypothetical protein